MIVFCTWPLSKESTNPGTEEAMSSQFTAARIQSGGQKPPPPQSVTYETRTIGSHEKIQLLRAPSIETDKIWKNRAFKYAYSRLRPKLCTRFENDYKPETLITVFSDHFPLATQNAEHEADEAVKNFHKKLQDVSNLTPLGFYDIHGNRQCHKMTKKSRPPNVCFIKIAADISMGEFATIFKNKECHLEFFLHLPQSNAIIKQMDEIESSQEEETDHDNIETVSMFATTRTEREEDDAENRVASQSAFSDVERTPKKKKSRNSSKNKKKKDNENVVSPQKGTHTVFNRGDDDGDEFRGKDLTESLEEENESNNDSFDIESIRHTAPKLASMLEEGRKARQASLPSSYYGPLNIFDNQDVYEDCIPERFQRFTLKPDTLGSLNIIDYDSIEKTIKQMSIEIKFETFCNEFRNDYVGEEDDEELMNHTVDKIREDLERIKMVYLNRTTGKMVYTSPETVFKKMNAYIELLPTNASEWSFCLPWMFFAALPNELQEEMKVQGFSRPPVATLSTKKLQSRALGQCRDSAVRAYAKLQETKRQVRAMIQSHSGNVKSNSQSNFLGYENERSFSTLAEHVEQSQATVLAYQQRSRAEITMQNAYNQRRQNDSLPEGFKQAMKNINGVDFPCHPNDPNKWSAFPVGFRGCYYCGDTQHGFTKCPKKEESDAVQVFHWNLHCHKPELWFRHQERRASKGQDRSPQKVQFQSAQAHSYGPSSHGMGRGRAATLPAWAMSRYRETVPGIIEDEDTGNESGEGYITQDDNIRKSYVAIVKCCNVRETRRMPITSQNELPHLDFQVGQPLDAMSLSFLYDTGAAINTGYLPYHKKIINECPQIVESYEEFNGSNPFEPIKLVGAITDPDVYDKDQHGVLSAVVRYKTPYFLRSGKAFILCFALGSDMSVNSIFGLPGILEIGLEPRFSKSEFLAHNLRAKFKICYRETTKTEVKKESNNVGIIKSGLKQSKSKRESKDDNEQATIPLNAISEATVAILETASLSDVATSRQ